LFDFKLIWAIASANLEGSHGLWLATRTRLLIAASGTGGHLFPAIALAELPDTKIEWLVSLIAWKQLVPTQYPLHALAVAGFQERFGPDTLRILGRLIGSICRQLLLREISRRVDGGYIAAPAVIAAHSGLPVILHEANALPGKVTRFFGPL